MNAYNNRTQVATITSNLPAYRTQYPMAAYPSAPPPPSYNSYFKYSSPPPTYSETFGDNALTVNNTENGVVSFSMTPFPHHAQPQAPHQFQLQATPQILSPSANIPQMDISNSGANFANNNVNSVLLGYDNYAVVSDNTQLPSYNESVIVSTASHVIHPSDHLPVNNISRNESSTYNSVMISEQPNSGNNFRQSIE